ncbi:tRNA 2-thiouridine(34) synthase MnmA [Candidatus Kaiserbacteria bacterium RIFCSPHIGHO2_01_FULL_55_17]|uniref:tRNA-specific 2-thiouridylase MnmA n=1 Tax=Candidatus Kaiserbacteria bacterium RIFCSPHIGHO2_01_FULL_55_17 TaxID=1798484 RepID=A0A1F6D7S3_9BACT|nr:MAG: tRNA 2-thiouridine(34) synthase MnmA [Candidatus Kaiserbacteria bacterium RIFCSPHIGHO2_01_FULL_55_17]
MSKVVYVGLSGGVDSAVSAALLQERGYEVVGCFIKIWQPEFLECTWREDRLDAMRAAAALRIPFRELDLSDEYKREVVDTMVAEYERGITPNPDVLCNRTIKFGHFAKWAREQGAAYVATGHYARIGEDAEKPTLLRGTDGSKDQSYFLHALTEDDLARTLFPVGELAKSQVRSLAEKFKLPNAQKPDSQGICFLGDVSMEEFLARFISLQPGAVLDMKGRTVGEHRGAALYTVGQRHGFALGKREEGVEVGPHYVVSIDVKANTITVSPNKLDADKKEIVLMHLHWINEPSSFPLEAEAQTRYRERVVLVRVEKENGKTRIIFAEPHIAAPGQSLVLYTGDRCLGGGTIS